MYPVLLDTHCLLHFRGRKIFEPPRYMLASQAASQLLEIVREKQADKEATTTAQPGDYHQAISKHSDYV